ncbi:MAG: DNA-directed RNA polymerase subunit alpha C-terminal domain-containing protein [Phycisphaerae bacterium]
MSETMNLASFFEVKDFDLTVYNTYSDMAHASGAARDYFRELVNDQLKLIESGQGGDNLRIGIALFLLGQYSDAIGSLNKSREERFRRWFLAHAYLALGKYEEAVENFQKAANGGWDDFECETQIGITHVRNSDVEAARKTLKKLERAGSDRADWYALAGLILEMTHEVEAAVDQYEKALTLEPAHTLTLFRAARLLDLRGEDDRAEELYMTLSRQPRANVNALINLAVLFEDRGRYEEARRCLMRVLSTHPNHARARLFLKDVESSRLMVIDDNVERKMETRSRLLDTPISEFELSVRARNCLKKMKIGSLGELIKLTEPELLSYKNFGETSLLEIKALLTKRNLKLGMNPDEVDLATLSAAAAVPPPAPAPVIKPNVPPGSEALLSKPVAELELSVRARRCLQRLNVVTLADLIAHTEHDLLSTRNFGVTSLTEIKQRLGEAGLSLAVKA